MRLLLVVCLIAVALFAGVAEAGSSQVTTITAGAGPSVVAVDSTRNLVFVTSVRSNTIAVLNGSTRAVTAMITRPPGGKGVALAVDPASGRLYDLDGTLDQVLVWDETTHALITRWQAPAAPRGIAVDTVGFEQAMQRQREKARGSWAGSGEAATETVWFGLREKLGATEFLGYETESAEGVVAALVKGGDEVSELIAGDEGAVVLNQTPFYGEAGGQVGDSGVLSADGTRFRVQENGNDLGAFRLWLTGDHNLRNALSGVAVARALSGDVRVLLLDEPFEGLAPTVVEQLFETFDRLRKEIAIIIVDHNLDLALALSDTTVALERGQVIYQGASKALRDDLDLRRKVLWL